MGRIIIFAATALIAFAGGLYGMYQAMPSIDPERVEVTSRYLDSLALADTLSKLDDNALALIQPPPVSVPDSLVQAMDQRDRKINTLRDSVQILMDALQDSRTSLDEVFEEVQEMQQRWEELEQRRSEAAKLSGTLARLEDRELKGVLASLSLPVLEQLYIESSNRNRTRLLQNMDADRAALVVRSLMDELPDSLVTAPLNAQTPPGT